MTRVMRIMVGHVLPPVVFLVLFFALWHLYVVAFDIKAFLVPPPASVFRTLVEQRAMLLKATWMTGAAALCGFAGSLLIGTLISLLFSRFTWVRRSCYPYAIFLQTVPIVAIAPIIINWFGSGFHSIVIVATVISLFPVITNATTGLISVPPALIDLFRVYRATAWQTQLKLRFPFALRYLIAGAKTSAGLAVVGSIVGEFFAGHAAENPGLGYIIQSSVTQLKTNELFAAVLLSTLLGILVFLLMSLLGTTVLKRWTRA